MPTANGTTNCQELVVIVRAACRCYEEYCSQKTEFATLTFLITCELFFYTRNLITIPSTPPFQN